MYGEQALLLGSARRLALHRGSTGPGPMKEYAVTQLCQRLGQRQPGRPELRHSPSLHLPEAGVPFYRFQTQAEKGEWPEAGIFKPQQSALRTKQLTMEGTHHSTRHTAGAQKPSCPLLKTTLVCLQA